MDHPFNRFHHKSYREFRQDKQKKLEDLDKCNIVIQKQNAKRWIQKRSKSSAAKSRPNEQATKDHDKIMNFASELFNLWDTKHEGKVELGEIISDFIALGLAPT